MRFGDQIDNYTDMIILNGERIEILNELFQGQDVGTVFHSHPELHFKLEDYVKEHVM